MKALKMLFIALSTWTMMFSPISNAQTASELLKLTTVASAISLVEKSDKKWANDLKDYFKKESIPTNTKLPKLISKDGKTEFEIKGEVFAIKTSPDTRDIEIFHKDKNVIVNTSMTIDEINTALKVLFTSTEKVSMLDFFIPTANAYLLYAAVAAPIIIVLTFLLDTVTSNTASYFAEHKRASVLASLENGLKACEEMTGKTSLTADEESAIEKGLFRLRDVLSRCEPKLTPLCNPLIKKECGPANSNPVCTETRKLASCLNQAKSASVKVSDKSRGLAKEKQINAPAASASQRNLER